MIELDNIKYNEKGLVPAVVQDANTREVLMVAYMNNEALHKTIETKRAWFYSRKRQKLWQKGETSGNFLEVKNIYYDCDEDTLLLQVVPKGPACHTGNYSCFYRSLLENQRSAVEDEVKNPLGILKELVDIIDSRFAQRPEGSYIAKLYEGGKERILKKVGEEACEVIIASMSKNKAETIYETADLLFHLLIALRFDNITIEEVMAELKRRRK
ncbi:MAG TPA: bifunctional phosphoribosyl-AMP cyclohydrolase/phosphoribosyl-ATP diphosphatase HisIE [Thermoanaerobacterales bacterium]|nr:bifunctional phosphoribosyl-AMP cyclohydrolase/phosphoribosyl-ATP diphosphatase HisIE [Thermoanaerobacterales bacterium]